MWVCNQCGNRNYDNARFCANCGNSKETVKKESGTISNIHLAIYFSLGVIIVGLVILVFVLVKSGKNNENSVENNVQTTGIIYESLPVETTQPTPTPTPTPTPAPTPTPVPTSTPAPTPDLSKPGVHDLIGCNESVLYPKDENWLSNYETKYVKTKHGVRAYLRYQPTEDSGYYDYVYEQALVTILARQNGYSLVKTSDGMAGWVTSSVLVDNY